MTVPTPPVQVPDPSSRAVSLRALIFRLTLGPALILALVLGGLLTQQQVSDRRQLLLSHGHASAEQLAELIELSDGQPLQQRLDWLHKSLLALMLEKDMVRSVHIYSIKGDQLDADTGLQVLATAGPRPRSPITDLHLKDREEGFIFEKGSGIQVLHPLRAGELTCWIAIELHRPYFTIGAYQVALAALLGLILCTLAALTWSIFLSERLARYLERMGKAVEEIGQGQLDRRIAPGENRELNVLAEHINQMAQNFASYQEEATTNLLQSMDDLRQSLDSMEEQNIELDLARKKALEASRVKSTFLANTSHEIRTPLNGIIGFTNLLLKTEVDELQQDYLQTILRSSENLLTTINDVLDFSRIESGNLVLDHIPLNLGQLLEETLQILAPFAHENRIELVPLIDEQLPTTLIGDPLRIKQVLTNLVGNAVRSSTDGNIPVRASVQSSRDAEIVVRISVTDLGNRIDEEGRRELRQLLENSAQNPGQQISSNGLGLAIARSLMERMRGSIGIDEAAGGGATFWVHIPLHLERNRNQPAQEQFPGTRILVADTNRMTRLQVSQLLKQWQVEAIELDDTSTLQPALEQMWNHDALPDAVIIDTAIAGDDVTSFVATIQQLVDTYQCRVIIQGSPVELRRCYEQLRTRVLTFLAKPVTRDNLLRALRRSLPQQAHNRPATTNQSTLPWTAPPRVLAVDDHEANRHLVSELLRALAIDVTIADSGEQAVRLCGQQRFDMVFMDIQMPGMDGIEATRKIRAAEKDGRMPIIALTAHAGAEEKARLLSAGLDDYLSKPVSENQLNNMVKRWMKILVPGGQAARQQGNPRLVDIAESLELSNRDATLARDMLQMLIKGLVADEQELNRCRANNDHRGLFELVHRLHGGCCYCGVPRLREATAALQEHLRPQQSDDNPDIDQQKVEAVTREIRALREWSSEQDLDILFGLTASA
ncbi:response regulator [Microbulbifer yueqingensis]|uniref:histidine kinase n=1 Tax=Microbulbifer yueqingensis TaxID=658219 RepID=A0A1G8URT0_9GAMM|nr:response regulator [Microbulbifer yueqingensis]SDJ56267.1 two-component system, NarL family, sensor histidine kinase BarA [Microbulbifer yueqingensis]